MFLLDPQHAYHLAMTRLKERFGNPSVITNAYYEKLSSWLRITDNDNNDLRKYSDFLQQCCVAQDLYSSLRILDHDKENFLIISKLPDKLVYRWTRGVAGHRHKFGDFPTLKTVAIFLQHESDIACDPVLSMQTVSSVRKHCMSNKSSDKSFVHDIRAAQVKFCPFCKCEHSLYRCIKFAKLSVDERFDFVKKFKLCFNCLTGGHSSQECTKNLSCKDCGRKHSNLLHFKKSVDSSTITDKEILTSFVNGRVGKEVSAFASGSQSQKCSMILPVYISHRCTKKRVLVYALLDTMSDTSFITEVF